MTQLTNPPLIVTDVATSVEYLNDQTLIQGNNYAGQYVDPSHRFGGQTQHFIALDTTPDGFNYPEHAKGVIGIYTANSGVRTLARTLHVAVHKPTHDLGDYQSGWSTIDGATLSSIGSDGLNSYEIYGAIASQRKGDYSYCLMHFDSKPFINIHTQQTTIWKVTRGEYAETGPISGSLSGGGDSVLDARGDVFVSDDEQPFLWNVYGQLTGNTAGGATTTPPVTVTGFRDDGGSSVGWKVLNNGVTYLHGQAGSYYQRYDLPPGMFGWGPYLVFPWVDGDYSPPELWWLLMDFQNGRVTGSVSVYRSTWKKNAYQALDPTVFPVFDSAMNANGYAFDHNWYQPQNFVGRFGPFQEVTFANPANTATAVRQNNETLPNGMVRIPAQYMNFNIQRDKTNYGSLHGFMQEDVNTVDLFTSAAGYNRVWYFNSTDDGSTWARPHILTPAATPDQNATVVASGNGAFTTTTNNSNGTQITKTMTILNLPTPTIPVVRTNEDFILLGGVAVDYKYLASDGVTPLPPHQIPAIGGGHVALIAVDYTGRGYGTSQINTAVFRGTATRSGTSWA